MESRRFIKHCCAWSWWCPEADSSGERRRELNLRACGVVKMRIKTYCGTLSTTASLHLDFCGRCLSKWGPAMEDIQWNSGSHFSAMMITAAGIFIPTPRHWEMGWRCTAKSSVHPGRNRLGRLREWCCHATILQTGLQMPCEYVNCLRWTPCRLEDDCSLGKPLEGISNHE